MVDSQNVLNKFLKSSAFGDQIYIAMGAGSISNWIKSFKINI